MDRKIGTVTRVRSGALGLGQCQFGRQWSYCGAIEALYSCGGGGRLCRQQTLQCSVAARCSCGKCLCWQNACAVRRVGRLRSAPLCEIGSIKGKWFNLNNGYSCLASPIYPTYTWKNNNSSVYLLPRQYSLYRCKLL